MRARRANFSEREREEKREIQRLKFAAKRVRFYAGKVHEKVDGKEK